MTGYDPDSADTVGIAVGKLIHDPGLVLRAELVAGGRGLERKIKHPRIQKSGLVLVGHTHGLVPARVQILGETELSFVEGLSESDREAAAWHMFSLEPACVLVTRGAEVPKAFVDAAEKSGTPIVVCQERTSQAITALHALLDERLAPRARLHGVLVDVFEVGVLLLGKSGIGKSEVALELVMRGHRLVADDVVECDYRPPGMVFGEAAPLLRHHIEVRGLGILDIQELYGVTAIRERKRIDLIVGLEEASGDAPMDRIGVEDRTHEILRVPIREVMLPVRPGRNISSIVEIAARHELLRQAGHDSARDFVKRVDAALSRKPNESGAMQAVTLPGPLKQTESHVPPSHGSQFDSNVPPAVEPKGKP